MARAIRALGDGGEAGAVDKVFLAQLREKFGLDQRAVQNCFSMSKALSARSRFSFRQQMRSQR